MSNQKFFLFKYVHAASSMDKNTNYASEKPSFWAIVVIRTKFITKKKCCNLTTANIVDRGCALRIFILIVTLCILWSYLYEILQMHFPTSEMFWPHCTVYFTCVIARLIIIHFCRDHSTNPGASASDCTRSAV